MAKRSQVQKMVTLGPHDFIRKISETGAFTTGFLDSLYAFENTLKWLKTQFNQSRSFYLLKVGYLAVQDKSARPGRIPQTGDFRLVSARRSIRLTKVKPKGERIDKGGFIKGTRRDLGFTRQQADAVYNVLVEMVHSVKEGHSRIEIRGFGGFYPRFIKAKVGRNPKTGESVMISEQVRVGFKCYPALHDAINPKEKKED